MKDEYVKKEDAIRLAEQGQVQGFPWQFQMLIRLSSVDVVPVVRCRDCKCFRYDTRFDSYWCGCKLVKPDDFCSHGERREEREHDND